MLEKVTVCLNDDSQFELRHGTHCDRLNPKELLLCAAAKCAGLTALEIMKKEKVTPKKFEVTVTGNLSTDTLQAESVFTGFNVIYNAEARNSDEHVKISRALNLGHEKYCGMVKMLQKIAPVSHEIAIVTTEAIAI